MPIYIYKALADNGAEVSGEVAAVSAQALSHELEHQGLLVQSVRQKSLGRALFARRFKHQDFLLFNQEFMALVRAGLTIPEALALSAQRPECPALGRVLDSVLDEVRNGVQLSDACERHPDVFDALYIAALKTGEKSGDLPSVLNHYQDYLRHKHTLQQKVSQAMAYPAFLLITLIVILGVLFVFVMPRFVAMYADFDTELPLPTRILSSLVENLPYYGPALLLLGIAVWIALRFWRSTEDGRMFLDSLKQRIPFISNVTRIVAAAQITRSLSTLLAGGTPLVEAMRISEYSLSNRVYAQKMQQVAHRVIEGESLAQALKQQDVIPSTGIKLVEVGEASGNLAGMLEEVARFYEEVLENRLTRIMALIEPALMLLMGVLIGGIIIVMYLPIFHMADIVR